MLFIGKKMDFEEQFQYLASELCDEFPDLDLRFNFKSGSNYVRYYAKQCSSEVFELELGDKRPSELLREAAFNIKQIARRFDS